MLITRSLLLTAAVVAMAASSSVPSARATDAGWVTVAGGFPLFDLAGIAPGDSGSATITVTNPQVFPATFTMSLISLRTDDNGCNEPEVAFGDTTCGPGGGELQNDLRLTLTALGAGDTLVAEGTVAEWGKHPAVDQIVLAGHEARTYRADYELPIGSSNLTQSDLVSFLLELRLEQVLGTEVASEAPTAVLGATGSLPGTGGDERADVMIGMGVLLTGLGLHRLSRQRGRST
jgi:hypothetical protein